jgi:hypothetical protein
LNIEDSIGVVSLGIYYLLLWSRQNLPAIADGCEEDVGIESAVSLQCRRGFHSLVSLVATAVKVRRRTGELHLVTSSILLWIQAGMVIFAHIVS